MKRSIITLALSALIFGSCRLEYGTTSKHTNSEMQSYTMELFNLDILQPSATINILIELDRYISASAEEQQSDEFKWHRENMFHEDDVTFSVNSLGTVYTYGKSFFDSSQTWKLNTKIERVDDNTWKVYASEYENNGAYSFVTYVERNTEGKNVFSVEAYDTDKCQTSYPDGDEITASISTPEGPVIVINPQYIYRYQYKNKEMPQGRGVFRIDTERNGEALDWMELRYSDSGNELIFHSSL